MREIKLCQVKALKLHKKCSTPLEPAILYIAVEGDKIGICERCWKRIADGDWEIGNGPKPTMEEFLSDKSRFGDNPIETEFKLKGSKKKVEEQDTDI